MWGMKKDELIAAIQNERRYLFESMEDLSDEELREPGVVGEWSTKDVLAHISRREADLVQMLYVLERGQVPAPVPSHSRDADARNAKWYREAKDRPWDRVRADLNGVHDQVIRRVQQLSDLALSDAIQEKPFPAKPLELEIAEASYLHEREHADQIRKWKLQRKKEPRS